MLFHTRVFLKSCFEISVFLSRIPMLACLIKASIQPPNKHKTLFRRLYNVLNVKKTSYGTGLAFPGSYLYCVGVEKWKIIVSRENRVRPEKYFDVDQYNEPGGKLLSTFKVNSKSLFLTFIFVRTKILISARGQNRIRRKWNMMDIRKFIWNLSYIQRNKKDNFPCISFSSNTILSLFYFIFPQRRNSTARSMDVQWVVHYR